MWHAREPADVIAAELGVVPNTVFSTAKRLGLKRRKNICSVGRVDDLREHRYFPPGEVVVDTVDSVLEWLAGTGNACHPMTRRPGLFTVGRHDGLTAQQVVTVANAHRRHCSPPLRPFRLLGVLPVVPGGSGGQSLTGATL